jgi:hypothetical protein
MQLDKIMALVHYLAPRTQPLLLHSIPPHAHQHQHSTTDRPTPDADVDFLVCKQPTNGINAFDSQTKACQWARTQARCFKVEKVL